MQICDIYVDSTAHSLYVLIVEDLINKTYFDVLNIAIIFLAHSAPVIIRESAL